VQVGRSQHLPRLKKKTDSASNTSKKLPGSLPTYLSTSGMDSMTTATTFAIINRKNENLPICEVVVLSFCPVTSFVVPFKYSFMFVCRVSTAAPNADSGGAFPSSSRYLISNQSTRNSTRWYVGK
jgi:hypothetical protein